MTDFQLEIKIKALAKQKGILLNDLCQKIEMTQSGFNIALKNNTLKIETLQKISEVLEVPISSFFVNIDSSIKSTSLNEHKNLIDRAAIQNLLDEIERISSWYIETLLHFYEKEHQKEIETMNYLEFKKLIFCKIFEIQQVQQIFKKGYIKRLDYIENWEKYGIEIMEKQIEERNKRNG